MQSIRPLESLSRAEVRELARAAAERCDQHINPFKPGTNNYEYWEQDYQKCSLELREP